MPLQSKGSLLLGLKNARDGYDVHALEVIERRTSSDANASSQSSESAPSTLRPSRTLPVSSSTTRGMKSPSQTRPSTSLSPSRTRPSTPVSPTSSTASRMGISSSVLNYITDVRTGKMMPINCAYYITEICNGVSSMLKQCCLIQPEGNSRELSSQRMEYDFRTA